MGSFDLVVKRCSQFLVGRVRTHAEDVAGPRLADVDCGDDSSFLGLRFAIVTEPLGALVDGGDAEGFLGCVFATLATERSVVGFVHIRRVARVGLPGRRPTDGAVRIVAAAVSRFGDAGRTAGEGSPVVGYDVLEVDKKDGAGATVAVVPTLIE